MASLVWVPPAALTSVPLLSGGQQIPLPATSVSWSLPQPGSVHGAPGVLSTATTAPLLAAAPWPQMDPSQRYPSPVTQPWLPPPMASDFSLSPATQPFPQKLVDKVRSGQFIEMRELLTDNISLLQQLESFNSQLTMPSLPGTLKPRLQEITSLPSWMYCFLAYVAIRSPDETY